MSVHSNPRKRRRDSQIKFKSLGNHEEFLERITKTLYYAELPTTERFSLPLSELAVELYSEVKCGRSLERLRLEDASEITRNACISPCSLVLAMLYLEQLKTSNPNYVDKVTSSDLFVISLMVASKFLNDNGEEDDVLNSEWATSAGISLTDLNRLEKEFLHAIDWKIFVKNSEFWKKLRSIEAKVALSEGKKRGWFSYTELEALLDQVNAFLLAQAVFTVSAVCLASYAAGMLTVIGSTMLATQCIYIPSSQQKPLTNATTGLTNVQRHNWDIPDIPPIISDVHLEKELFLNGTEDDCLDNKNIWYYDNMSAYDGNATESASFFYRHFLVPMSYNIISFPVDWKHVPLHMFSH